jgi:hypothetical protein
VAAGVVETGVVAAGVVATGLVAAGVVAVGVAVPQPVMMKAITRMITTGIINLFNLSSNMSFCI